jgi:hypothetical protein
MFTNYASLDRKCENFPDSRGFIEKISQ